MIGSCCSSSVLALSLRWFSNHCHNSLNWFWLGIIDSFRLKETCLRVFLAKLCLNYSISIQFILISVLSRKTSIDRIASFFFKVLFHKRPYLIESSNSCSRSACHCSCSVLCTYKVYIRISQNLRCVNS